MRTIVSAPESLGMSEGVNSVTFVDVEFLINLKLARFELK